MRWKKNVPVKPYTRFGVGGTVAYFTEVSCSPDLLAAVKEARQKRLPYYIVAGGSNLAFADGRLNIALIRVKESIKVKDKIVYSGKRVKADAGVQLWMFIKALIENGYAGMEKLSGIPGTLGGAIVGNAGAYGVEMREFVTRVKIFDGQRVRWVPNQDCGFRYRHSVFKEKPWLVLEAELSMRKDDPAELKKVSSEILAKRAKFKWDMKTPGSYFKNLLADSLPPKIAGRLDKTKFIGNKVPVGYLLEEVGSKGYRVGGIAVSDFHANVFINDGTGSYRDLVELVTELKRRVKEKFGIDIEEEVRRVDENTFKTFKS